MNIFMLTETESGCYKWRAAGPAKYLRKRGHSVHVLSNELRGYEAPDVLVFYRAHYPQAYKMVEWCKKNSIRVVFDTDDALDLVPKESLYYQALQDRIPLYEFLLEEADVVTTTTETLASHLRSWNPNVVVIPNSVDPEEWRPTPRGSGVRVGWSGAPNHLLDVSLVFDAVRELQKKYPFTFVLQGICREATLEEFHANHVDRYGKAFSDSLYGKTIRRFLTKLEGIRHEFHPLVDFDQHSQKLCDLALDIGVAPLIENDFNRNKSCIKYYEYAMSGAVTVASQVLPYSIEVPVTAKNNRDAWKHKLESALSADRDSIGREQRDWVLANRNLATNVLRWERAFAGQPAAAVDDPVLEACPGLQA